MFARTPQRLGIGFKKITQRRRSRGRIIQFKQSHYEPKPKNYEPIPMSVLGTGPLRRLVHSPKEEAEELMKKVDWNAYKTGVPGVRWHPTGGFRVQFKAHYKPKNFKVNCDMYFRVALYGFAEAKRRAIAYFWFSLINDMSYWTLKLSDYLKLTLLIEIVTIIRIKKT